MLIVSKVLLSRQYEHGAWQLDESKKRDLSSYVLVTGDLLRTVAKSVFSTALALDLEKHVSLSDVLRILSQWALRAAGMRLRAVCVLDLGLPQNGHTDSSSVRSDDRGLRVLAAVICRALGCRDLVSIPGEIPRDPATGKSGL